MTYQQILDETASKYFFGTEFWYKAGLKFGYSRDPIHEQNQDIQQDALIQAGCVRIFTDTCSGSASCVDRLGLQSLCGQLRSNDVLVVWRLERLGRNLRGLPAFDND